MTKKGIKIGSKARINAPGLGFSARGVYVIRDIRPVPGKRYYGACRYECKKHYYIHANGSDAFMVCEHEIRPL